MIFHLSKPLIGLGYSGLLMLAALGNVVADEPSSPAAPDDSQTSDSSQNPPNSPVPNTPLLPQQAANPYQPFSSSTSNIQSPQLTAPSLYTTGVNDVSQIAVNNALVQAFSQQPASGFLSEQGASYSQPPIDRIRLGPFDLKATLLMNVVSDDNILATGGNGTGTGSGGKISDTSFGLTPAVLLQYGTHEGEKGYASLVYAPTLTRYFEHSDLNSDNQNVAFNAVYPFQRLTLDLSETYAEVTGINQDLNARTTQNSSLTIFGGNYDIDDKLSFASHLQELITTFSGGQGGVQGQGDTITSLNSSFTYQITDKVKLTPGLNVGLEKPQNTAQQTFEQALVGVTYQPTEKINFFAQGGAEFRQYDSSDEAGETAPGKDVVNPIFSAGVGYTPFDSTTLTVSAYQDVYASSAESNESVVSTGVGVSATQRFFQRLYLNFNFNYAHNEGQADTGGASSGSQDTLVYRPSLSFAPTAWTSLAVYYQYLDNESNTQGASYHDNQLGVSASVQF
ncbi:MAG TPA: outer membrane beta-barrel protein [Candidatus Methylacidiphilales bacterium]|jgi:hypothetical protein|nr:outer membrane beta-barrel protein [Candidatus Methylacidiphilales bacterium]